MTFSFAALLSTLLLSSTIVFLQIFLLKKLKINYLLSATLLMTASIIFIVRLCFPVEFFFTKTLPSKVILPYIDSILIKNIIVMKGFSISLEDMLLIIWLIGAIICFTRFVLLLFKIHKLKRLLMVNPSFDYRNRRVVLIDEVVSPVVIGFFNPIILLPNLDISERQREFILEHELFHISNFDIWIKYVYELLSIVYWWNPVVYIFKKSFNQIIELKADESVVSQLTSREKIEYVETLLKVGSQINRRYFKTQNYFFPSFTSSNPNDLVIRANYIFSEQNQKPSKMFIVLFTVFCFYLSSCIVFETYFIEPKVENSTIRITGKDSYLIRISDDKYKVYKHNTYLFEVSEENREIQFPDLKIFNSIKEREQDVQKNN